MRQAVAPAAAALVLMLAVGCGSPDSDGTQGAPASATPSAAESKSPFTAGGAGVADAPQAPAPPGGPANDTTVQKDIVTTGTMRMTVASPTEAADKFVDATVAAGGHVESRSEQSGHGRPTVELILRIPSSKVDGVLDEVGKLGTVDSMQIGHEDVTAQRVDLDARIRALQTSVDRLLDLMSKATSTSALLEAESTLTQRQADLDSLKSQRAALGDQIAYSTITVDLATEPEVIAPGGFSGAVKDGWDALVKLGGALAATFGFLLSWIPIFALLVGAIWLLRRRQLRRHPKSPTAKVEPAQVEPASVESTRPQTISQEEPTP
jgi:hypothetical protein